MIRYVPISKEVSVVPNADCFAWFDTVSDSFFEFNGEQVWTSWAEFEGDWREGRGYHELSRYWDLFTAQAPDS